MNRKALWSIRLVSIGYCFGIIYLNYSEAYGQVDAEIQADSTLGTKVLPDSVQNKTIIQGGQSFKRNLFHSFIKFSIPKHRSIQFQSKSSIRNIFVRVTGQSSSLINGELEVVGPANFFFLNPHGIYFGENAGLKLNGSFLATTAESIQFDNGRMFSSVDSKAPLLNLNVPIGLQFGSQPGAIISRAGNGNVKFRRGLFDRNLEQSATGGLVVPSGQTLALLGGDLFIRGSTIRAPGGMIELGSVGKSGFVGVNINPQKWSFDYRQTRQFKDILVTGEIISPENLEDTYISTSQLGRTSGDIHVRGRHVQIKSNPIPVEQINQLIQKAKRENHFSFDEEGQAQVDIETVIIAPEVILDATNHGKTKGGDIQIDASQSLRITDLPTVDNPDFRGPQGGGIRTGLIAHTNNGDAGNIILNSPKVLVKGDFARVRSSSVMGENVPGKSSDIIVMAQDWVHLDDRGTLATTSLTSGDVGTIKINTGTLLMRDAGNITAELAKASSGKNGIISIEANKRVLLTGGIPIPDSRKPTDIRNTSNRLTSGKPGKLSISTPHLLIDDEGSLNATTEGQTDAGEVILNVGNLTLKNGGQLILQAKGSGDAASLSVNGYKQAKATKISILGSGELSQATINPSGVYAFNATPNLSDVSQEGNEPTGSAGNLILNAKAIEILDGAILAIGLVQQNSPNQSPGSLEINASRLQVAGGSELGASKNVFVTVLEPISQSPQRLTSGEITLNVDRLDVSDRGEISVSTASSTLPGGSITIKGLHPNQASRIIQLSDRAQIIAETSSTADGGDIKVRAKNLILSNRSNISVSGRSNTPNSTTGAAGSISIEDSRLLVLVNGASILANTQSSASPLKNQNQINIKIPGVLYLVNNSSITTNAASNADGGAITINAGLIIGQSSSNSDIVANAQLGQGGEINLVTQLGVFGFQIGNPSLLTSQQILMNPSNDITAFSDNPQQSVQQSISIPPPLLDPDEVVVPPEEFLLPVVLIPSQCIASSNKTSSGTFIDVGKGGISITPVGENMSDIWEDTRTVPSDQSGNVTQTTPFPSSSERPHFVEEAFQWYRSSTGQVLLTHHVPYHLDSKNPQYLDQSCYSITTEKLSQGH